jgi:hypothetical protein
MAWIGCSFMRRQCDHHVVAGKALIAVTIAAPGLQKGLRRVASDKLHPQMPSDCLAAPISTSELRRR